MKTKINRKLLVGSSICLLPTVIGGALWNILPSGMIFMDKLIPVFIGIIMLGFIMKQFWRSGS